ncbi:uncharacterized protein LOC126747220 [Anthonomus grandis grandis]|uniref:uncharacterized protein LOC126747220 n=1 Tax=Anthonomus grandis grandis TaxID=2921223 RepID=UPI002166387F|nr:uncharacterized protein LOC126747220 [Anthonomus grandis grandis]
MAGFVLIVSIPTEEHEKCLLKKLKKKVGVGEKDDGGVRSEGVAVEVVRSECGAGVGATKEYRSMEQVIRSTTKDLEITDVTWRKTEDDHHYQIVFPMECGQKCEEILNILKEHEIGNKLNSKINVLPCTIHYHGNAVNENDESVEEEDAEDTLEDKKNSGWNLFVSSVRSRLTVAQVVENVKAKAAMTFDFIMLLLISSTLCALGLVENNPITMLSSMLISPMMGPVMAGTFGSVIRDKHLQKVGVKNELIGLGIATLVGFFYGTIICLSTDRYGTSDWPTYQMYSGGQFRALWVGTIIALLSGAAVALGILSDNIASLVGVAISTSLMPPAVNAGLLWSLGLVYYVKHDGSRRYASLTRTDYFSSDSAVEMAALGATSICLTFINIVCIYFAGILVFMIKEVAPHTSQNQARKRFWKHDIRVARNYNKTIQSDEGADAYQSILDQISEGQRVREYNHFFTDTSRGNFRSEVKRPEYTWSPCVNDVTLGNRALGNPSGNLSRKLQFTTDPRPKRSKYRRLSQIFPKPMAKTEEDLERVGETTPLLPSSSSGAGKSYLLSSGKKILVTPCEVDLLS